MGRQREAQGTSGPSCMRCLACRPGAAYDEVHDVLHKVVQVYVIHLIDSGGTLLRRGRRRREICSRYLYVIEEGGRWEGRREGLPRREGGSCGLRRSQLHPFWRWRQGTISLSSAPGPRTKPGTLGLQAPRASPACCLPPAALQVPMTWSPCTPATCVLGCGT